MTTVFANQTFKSLNAIGWQPELSDMEFVRCAFIGCKLVTIEDPSTRALVQNVHMRDCRLTACAMRGAIVQNTTIENLVNTSDLLLPQACAFKHVTLRGRLPRMMLGSRLTSVPPTWVEAFERANAHFYESVDWALDITEAQVDRELEIRDIPTRAIRRDPARHVVVRRERVTRADWRNLDLSGAGGLRILLSDLAQYGPDSAVFVIPDHHPRRARIAAAVEQLRDLGVVEQE